MIWNIQVHVKAVLDTWDILYDGVYLSRLVTLHDRK